MQQKISNRTNKEEKKMRNMKGILAILMMGGLLVMGTLPSWATSTDDPITLTATVNTVVAITDGIGNFTLTFTDFVNGTLSNQQLVVYNIRANNMPSTSLGGILSGKLSALINGVDVKASPQTFANTGTAGDIGSSGANTAVTSAPANTLMATTATGLLDKGAAGASPDADKDACINGTIGVNWKGTLTKDRKQGSGNATLTVTLKDV